MHTSKELQERKKLLADASLGEGTGKKLGKLTVAECVLYPTTKLCFMLIPGYLILASRTSSDSTDAASPSASSSLLPMFGPTRLFCLHFACYTTFSYLCACPAKMRIFF